MRRDLSLPADRNGWELSSTLWQDDAWMSWVIFPMVVSVLWAGVRRGRGLDRGSACGEGEMEHWADRPQQFPICLFESLDWLADYLLCTGTMRKKKEETEKAVE